MKDTQKTDVKSSKLLIRWAFLLSLIILAIGCVGYFMSSRNQIIFYVFAHLGALGILGLIGGIVGILARKKGRSTVTAMLTGILLPIAVGITAVLAKGGQISCAGSVSLAVAIIIVVVYSLISKKALPNTGHAA